MSNELSPENERPQDALFCSHGIYAVEQAKAQGATTRPILTLRSHTGLAGDMWLAGLASLLCMMKELDPASSEASEWLAKLVTGIMPQLKNTVNLRKIPVNGIFGWRVEVNLPEQHSHRGVADIGAIIAQADMHPRARQLASSCFELLALSEGAVHNLAPEEIHFHEVGALDSILDICASCELYVRLGEPLVICSALPMADGEINCAHGALPAPAPAVLRLLPGIKVCPFKGGPDTGELVTPTGIALLRSFQAEFGKWPEFNVLATTLVYGQKIFTEVANGLIMALGEAN